MSTMVYPKRKNAFEDLKTICMNGLMRKYSEPEREAAKVRLDDELDWIEQNGFASAYMTVLDALAATDAKPDEFFMAGSIVASIVAFTSGMSVIDPISCIPKVYPELFWGWNRNRDPYFGLLASTDLYNRLIEYFDHFPGEDHVEPKTESFEDLEWFEGYYIGEPAIDEHGINHTFYVDIKRIDHPGYDCLREISEEILNACHPETYADFVKCYSLSEAEGTWGDDVEKLLKEGVITFSDLISDREDAYERLQEWGIPKEDAYILTERIRKGMMCKEAGWEIREEDMAIMTEHNVPDWFIDFCTKVRYLSQRGHAMVLVDAYIKKYPDRRP